MFSLKSYGWHLVSEEPLNRLDVFSGFVSERRALFLNPEERLRNVPVKLVNFSGSLELLPTHLDSCRQLLPVGLAL